MIPYLSISGEGGNRSIDLTTPAILGRKESLHEYEDRTMPIDVSNIKTFILIDDVAKHVSRNHALVNPNDDGSLDLWDLNSENGTKVRIAESHYTLGKSTETFKTTIYEDDTIILNGHQLTYGLREPDPNYSRRQALLVGNKADLRGTHNNVRAVEGILTRRSFSDGDITQLLDKQSSKKRVMSELERVKEESGDNGLFVFYYAGHGDGKGRLCTYSWLQAMTRYLFPIFGYIKPKKVCKALQNIKGNKVVILDTCFAGDWKKAYEKYVPDRTLILASSKEGKVSYETAYGSGTYKGVFTRALEQMLNRDHNYLNLKGIKPELNAIMRDFHLGSEPQMMTLIGQSIILDKPKTNI